MQRRQPKNAPNSVVGFFKYVGPNPSKSLGFSFDCRGYVKYQTSDAFALDAFSSAATTEPCRGAARLVGCDIMVDTTDELKEDLDPPIELCEG